MTAPNYDLGRRTLYDLNALRTTQVATEIVRSMAPALESYRRFVNQMTPSLVQMVESHQVMTTQLAASLIPAMTTQLAASLIPVTRSYQSAVGHLATRDASLGFADGSEAFDESADHRGIAKQGSAVATMWARLGPADRAVVVLALWTAIMVTLTGMRLAHAQSDDYVSALLEQAQAIVTNVVSALLLLVVTKADN